MSYLIIFSVAAVFFFLGTRHGIRIAVKDTMDIIQKHGDRKLVIAMREAMAKERNDRGIRLRK